MSVTVAQVVLQTVTLALTFQAGVNYNEVALQARARVVAAVNALAPGATLSRVYLADTLRSVPGLIVSDASVIYSPSGDVTPLPLQVLRTSMALVLPVGLQPVGALQSTLNPDAE